MMELFGSLAAISAASLVLAICLYRWPFFRAAHKMVLPFLAIAGLGITGIIGTVLTTVVRMLFEFVGTITSAIFGYGLPALIAIVMTFKFVSDIRGSNLKRSSLINAFMIFPILTVPASGLIGWIQDTVLQVGPLVGDLTANLGVG